MPYTYNPFINNLDYYAAVGSSTVFGPGSSTNNALALWDGTTGTLLNNSDVTYVSDQFLAPNGSTGAPTYSFTAFPTTGIFTDGTNLYIQGGGFATGSFGFNVSLSGGTTTITQGFVLTGIQTKTAGFTTGYNISVYLIDTVTAAAPMTIQLVSSPITGQIYTIKDSTGAAATYNITISGTASSKNIDGATTTVINVNYGSVQLIYNGSQWNVI